VEVKPAFGGLPLRTQLNKIIYYLEDGAAVNSELLKHLGFLVGYDEMLPTFMVTHFYNHFRFSYKSGGDLRSLQSNQTL